MTLSYRFAVLLLLILASAPSGASAQDDATRAAAARAMFGEGVAAADAEDWGVAVERFERARALRASPTIALNLAIALGHVGRVVEAVELLRAASRDPAASEAVRASAAQTLPELEPRVAWVRLTVRGASDATLQVDGRALPAELLGEAVPLDPGAHRFAAMRGADEVAFITVTVAEGERAAAELSVPELAPEPTPIEPVAPIEPVDEELPIEPPPPPPSSGPDPLALGLGIGGGVIVVGGVLTLVLVLALPSQASPFVGNAGRIEVGP